ncbi:MAG TPA: biosynthetic arginine decarboxylase [Rhodothermia bacterium]
MTTRLKQNQNPAKTSHDAWSPQDSHELYHFDAWSDGYFFVNDLGHVAVRPTRESSTSIDVATIVEDIRTLGIRLPVVIRFQDVLRSRVVQLNEAFIAAIDEFSYGNRYAGVYPIKVNQLHEVVEEVLEAGEPYGMGLECGSKAELVAALPHLKSDSTLLICNGYKDSEMLDLIMMGQRLGKAVIPVIEKYDEFERFIGLAEETGFAPRFGVRVKLSTGGVGRWATSSGDASKFGLSLAELLRIAERVRSHQGGLVLLHFHLGSQVSDIQQLKLAVKEITQVYAQLRKRGTEIEFVDVGGGLGVNYESGYTSQEEGINYSLTEYANSVIYAIKEVCDTEGVPVPTVVSESGRAVTAHHSLLVVETLAAYRREQVDPGFSPADTDNLLAHDLFDALQRVSAITNGSVNIPILLEAYHDAVEKRMQAHALFGLGYLPIEQKAIAESLFWAVCNAVFARTKTIDPDLVPSELGQLDELLVDQYLCDFSVFQSMLDHWAIDQRFPITPLKGHREEPVRRAVLVDLTCDSDGKVASYIGPEAKPYLEVHPLRPGEPYHLCFFLMGAYQDIMGDMHNLFGRVTEVHVYADDDEPEGYYVEKIIPGATVQEMLALVQYFPNDLQRRMQKIIRTKVSEGLIRPKTGVEMLDRYERAFTQFTYLKPSQM